MQTRPATEADARLIFDWRNDPVTVTTFRSGAVDWDAHSKWFPAQLARPDVVCLIGEHEGQPCGVVWFHKNRAGVWETSVNLSPDFRGKKLSAPMLTSAMHEMRIRHRAGYFSTEIKNDNISSIKMFERCGFVFVFQQPEFGTYCTLKSDPIFDSLEESALNGGFIASYDRDIQAMREGATP